MTKSITCIECPIGCQINVELNSGKVVSITGNTCNRGKVYAENEVVCPKRVLTTIVKSRAGEMIPVKTDKPVRKDAMMDVMKTINKIECKTPVALGQVLVENIFEDANLIVTGNF